MKEWVVVGRSEEFQDGRCRIVEVGDLSIGVYNVGGELYAVRNLCPHQLAPICLGAIGGTMLPSGPGEYIYGMDGYVLACVAHAWEFDIRTGEALFGIDRRRLATYPVKVDGGQVALFVRGAIQDSSP